MGCAHSSRVRPNGVQSLDTTWDRNGYSLPQLMKVLRAKIVVVSTPESGSRCGGPPWDEVPVMSGLERLAGYLFPNLIPAYDFAGSSSAQECRAQIPDRELHKYFDVPEGGGWARPDIISKTQWMRYWMGGVRAALKAMLLSAEPLLQTVSVGSDLLSSGTLYFPPGTRTLFAISIGGGTITQTEKKALAGLIQGAVADLSTRDIDIGDVHVHWLHFDLFEDFLKALQGFVSPLHYQVG